MNNQEFMEDIKQLLRAEISGAVQHLDRRMDAIEQRMAVREDLKKLSSHMDTRFEVVDAQLNTVLDAIGERADAVDVTQKDHERRITRLEHHPA